MCFDYEVITDNGKHARTTNGLNDDSSHIDNVLPNVALRASQQSTPTHLIYKVFYGNKDDAKARTKR